MGFIPGRSPYEILGVPEGSGMAVVRKRFFREARRWHPDKHQGDSEEEIENAHLRFVQIHAAYQAILREGILEGPRQQADAPTFENEAFQRWTRERHLEQRLDEAEEAHENTKAELDEINDYLETQRDLARNQALYTAEEFEAAYVIMLHAGVRTLCERSEHIGDETQATLKFPQPGCTWACDGVEPPEPEQGRCKYVVVSASGECATGRDIHHDTLIPGLLFAPEKLFSGTDEAFSFTNDADRRICKKRIGDLAFKEAQLLLQNREQQYKAQVNKLRMRQKHLQQLSRSQSAPPKSRRSEEEPEKEPKSLMDATESALCYLGESVTQTCMDVSIFCGELAEEVTDAMSSMAAYFRAWRIVRDDE
ncbi:unnamed protein product [Durusdinium trenchii]|uniref:J domain-containing protein n=1 Tax=Durusdinium trenchii TaxID=1381693 RepID=A0ABP0I4W2_9DINO